jgi:hypothetical protein
MYITDARQKLPTPPTVRGENIPVGIPFRGTIAGKYAGIFMKFGSPPPQRTGVYIVRLDNTQDVWPCGADVEVVNYELIPDHELILRK